MENKFKNKAVLVTGACGTVGGELIRQLCELGVREIVAIDNNESEMFYLKESYRSNQSFKGFIADIRELDALKEHMRGIDIVLHAAALKHVGLCEESPVQAVRTNIFGTQNVISAAVDNNVERVIFTSSDKAVNPTNVMGTSKLMGERLFTAAATNHSSVRTIFASTRFGNILGSNGSVVPLFKRQISNGGPITLTDREMTRFVMSLQDACKLVLDSVWLAEGGEVFVTKMPVARIEDIAAHYRDTLGGGDVEIIEIGSKPGEKLYEELMNDEEVRRTYDVDNFFIIVPAFVGDRESRYPIIKNAAVANRPYHSAHESTMNVSELSEYLELNQL